MEEAMEAYLKAAGFAEKYLGPSNPLTKTMKETARNVKATQEREKLRKIERQSKSSYRLLRAKSDFNSSQ